MIKSTLKLLTATLMLVSSYSFAGYISTDLTEDSYITYAGYDWTWASSVNVTNYNRTDFFTSETLTNTFSDASVHTGWMSFAAGSDLDLLFQQLTLAHFMDSNNQAIHSIAYWNSDFIDVDDVFKVNHANYNPLDFAFRSGMKDDSGNFETDETFYVRATVAKVPEPTSIFMLAAGLLGFAMRKRITK